MAEQQPLVGVIMGSQSDWPTMQHACDILDELGVAYEKRIVSAHRTPERLMAYAREARGRGLKCIIAGAGGAAHLPGMAAAWTVCCRLSRCPAVYLSAPLPSASPVPKMPV